MSLFGNPSGGSSSTGTGLFGQPASNTTPSSNLFGGAATSSAPTASSLFGANAAATSSAPSGSSLFGNAAASKPATSLFGNTATSQPASTSLFGNTAASQPTQASSLFGAAAATSQPTQSGGLFGGAASTTNNNAAGSGLFGGASSSQPGASTGLFGAPQPATSGLFGGAAAATTTTNANANAGGSSLFGQPSNPNASKPGFGSIFGNNNTQQQLGQSTMQPAQEDFSQSMMDSRRIWNEQDGAPRSRTVIEQLQLVQKKWDPASTEHSFQTYLYNQVSPDAQPFYRPAPGESEEAWEDALRKAPNSGAIPFRVRGFYELGLRIVSQRHHLDVLSGRLHEINNGLTTLLRKHELEIASRTAAARRRHAALSQRVLALTTKTMLARNRGYALDGVEEELRKKLVTLERGVMDPALSGREEEIWARMVSVREKGKLLEAELIRAGLHVSDEDSKQEISDEVMKRAKKILEDYDSQLGHLNRELEQIKKDWADWESSKGFLQQAR